MNPQWKLTAKNKRGLRKTNKLSEATKKSNKGINQPNLLGRKELLQQRKNLRIRERILPAAHMIKYWETRELIFSLLIQPPVHVMKWISSTQSHTNKRQIVCCLYRVHHKLHSHKHCDMQSRYLLKGFNPGQSLGTEFQWDPYVAKIT